MMQSIYNVSVATSQKGKASWLITLFSVAIIIVSIIVATLTYRFSYQKGYHEANEESKVTVDGIQMHIKEGFKDTELENELLKSEAESAKQERDISLGNLADLRSKLEDLETKNLQIEQTIELYGKNISKQGGIPLQIIAAKIEPLPENVFEYQFDILQLATNGKPNTLFPKVSVLNHTSFVDVPLEPRTYEIQGVSRIRGRFVMPKGFNPLQIKLELTAGSEELEQLYNWKLGKRKSDVPLSLSEISEVNQRPIGSE